jgi:hypothetical protein
LLVFNLTNYLVLFSLCQNILILLPFPKLLELFGFGLELGKDCYPYFSGWQVDVGGIGYKATLSLQPILVLGKITKILAYLSLLPWPHTLRSDQFLWMKGINRFDMNLTLKAFISDVTCIYQFMLPIQLQKPMPENAEVSVEAFDII